LRGLGGIKNNIAQVLRNQRKDKKAREMNRRVLEGMEEALGIEHLSAHAEKR
jgi:hypothetical protein